MKASSEILLAVDNRRETNGEMTEPLHLHKLHYMDKKQKSAWSSVGLIKGMIFPLDIKCVHVLVAILAQKHGSTKG